MLLANWHWSNWWRSQKRAGLHRIRFFAVTFQTFSWHLWVYELLCSMSSFYSQAKWQTNINAKDQVFLNIVRSHARREKLILHRVTVTQVTNTQACTHTQKKRNVSKFTCSQESQITTSTTQQWLWLEWAPHTYFHYSCKWRLFLSLINLSIIFMNTLSEKLWKMLVSVFQSPRWLFAFMYHHRLY